MSKRAIEFFIVDILIACDKIKRYSEDFSNGDELLHDEKSFDAVMRELQIIGEATKQLIKDNILSDEYRIIVDFRNLIVHEYFGIDSDEIWGIISNDLLEFKSIVRSLLLSSKDTNLLNEIINFAIEDFKYSKDTVKFLDNLLNEIK